MEQFERALLLVGSPKVSGSNSASLGQYLLDQLGNGGFRIQTGHIQTLMHTAEGQQAMLELVKASDLLVLAFPLYIDCLPAAVILALEKIAQQSDIRDGKRRLVAIVNNGFPEASQNNTALAICRRFASEAGFEWAGGLGMGGGGVIGGKKLERAGFPVKNAKKALDLAAKDLLEGKPVSEAAVDLMAKSAIPRWLYFRVGNYGWKQLAKRHGAEKKLDYKP